MTTADFSNGFDVLLNSYSRVGAFGDSMPDIRLDEYEKSLFMTQAQEDEVRSLYTGKNVYGEGFEKTEETRRYLSTLVKEAEIEPLDEEDDHVTLPAGLSSNSQFFALPDDLWFITYEAVNVTGKTCNQSEPLEVIPVRQDEYHKIKKNPFRGTNDRRALRLDLSGGNIEVISKYSIATYYVRYLRKLNPIVLTALEDGVTINNVSTVTACELPDILHQRILERAVMLALRSKGIGVTSQPTKEER